MVDLGLLFSLYEIHSPSGGEKRMRKFLKKKCYELGATSVVQDKTGNLLVTKGESETYPCIVSHIDQVQSKHSKDFRCYRNGAIVFAYSGKSMEQQGLGADDKNGIYVCLECLKNYDNVKCAFFVGEETGCIGSSAVDLDFFKDCRFILQCDRRNGHDLITSIIGDLCSKEFLDDTDYKNYGYRQEDGLSTDVGELVDRGVGLSCINMSCGYYHPHTDTEVTNITELDNCKEFVFHIFDKMTKVYKHEPEFSYSYGYGRYSRCYSYDYDDWYGNRAKKSAAKSAKCFDIAHSKKPKVICASDLTPSDVKSQLKPDEPQSYKTKDGYTLYRTQTGLYVEPFSSRYFSIDHEKRTMTEVKQDTDSPTSGDSVNRKDSESTNAESFDAKGESAEEIDEYENYFHDYNLMRDLLEENWDYYCPPTIEDILITYSDKFTCTERAYLSDIYNDASQDICAEQNYLYN